MSAFSSEDDFLPPADREQGNETNRKNRSTYTARSRRTFFVLVIGTESTLEPSVTSVFLPYCVPAETVWYIRTISVILYTQIWWN